MLGYLAVGIVIGPSPLGLVDDIHACAAEIEHCVHEAARRDAFMRNRPPEIEQHGFMAEGYVLENVDRQIALLARCHSLAHQAELETRAGTGTTDARCFGLYADTPAMVYGPLAENIHAFDERVSLESTRKVTQAIALFMAGWCGLRPLD